MSLADERRMLGALERLRLQGVSSHETNGIRSSVSDRPTTTRAAVETTPTRRKSSMLTLSHLTPVTPVRVAASSSPSRLASDAVRDMARELEAVEARLSVFREHRETVSTAQPEPTQESLVEKETTTTEPAPSSAPRQPTQQAGEVVDEVEHALANCDRLLQQAKLQASAASMTRSLRSSSGSRTPPLARSTRGVAAMRRPYSTSEVVTDAVDASSDPSCFSGSAEFPEVVMPTSTSADDEMELEATARAMKALVGSHERQVAREETAVRDHHQRMRAAQLREIERKFESKKTMLILSLREKCEAETRAVVKQTTANLEKEQQDALAAIEQKMISDREQMLGAILVRHQADTEDQIKRIQVRLHAETLKQKQELEKQLQQEFDDTIRQIEQDTETELRRWEQKQRLGMETDILTRREQAATAILRAQEAKTQELKQQMHQQYTAKEIEEMDKLKKALAFGAQAQLQQLSKQLDVEHEQKMSDIRTEAAQTLEVKLADLKQVLKIAHRQELEQTQRDLEKRHRVAVMETHEKLDIQHRTEIAEMTNKAEQELETTLATLRSELEHQNKAKLDALQQTIDRDHQVRLRQLELDFDRECETALEHLRHSTSASNQREIESKLCRLEQSKRALLDEALLFLSITPEEKHAANGRTNTTESLLQLKQLGACIPKELQRAVATLVQDFEELSEEQQILLEKISDSTGLYLSFKRQCMQLEAEVNELRAIVESVRSQLQAKDDLAKKLYMANEALLKKLGIDPLK